MTWLIICASPSVGGISSLVLNMLRRPFGDRGDLLIGLVLLSELRLGVLFMGNACFLGGIMSIGTLVEADKIEYGWGELRLDLRAQRTSMVEIKLFRWAV